MCLWVTYFAVILLTYSFELNPLFWKNFKPAEKLQVCYNSLRSTCIHLSLLFITFASSFSLCMYMETHSYSYISIYFFQPFQSKIGWYFLRTGAFSYVTSLLLPNSGSNLFWSPLIWKSSFLLFFPRRSTPQWNNHRSLSVTNTLQVKATSPLTATPFPLILTGPSFASSLSTFCSLDIPLTIDIFKGHFLLFSVHTSNLITLLGAALLCKCIRLRKEI